MTTPTPLADRIRLCKGLTSRVDLARDLDQLSSDCADLERELAELRAQPAPEPSVDVEALVKSVTGNDHQRFIYTTDVARRIRAYFARQGGKP